MMNLLQAAGLVTLAGLLGGLGHGLVAGAFSLPRFDRKRQIWKPGVIGDLLVGGLAALVVWTVYGAAASYDLSQGKPLDLPLPVAQLGMSVLIGISGAKVLTKLSEQTATRALKNEFAKILLEQSKKAADK